MTTGCSVAAAVLASAALMTPFLAVAQLSTAECPSQVRMEVVSLSSPSRGTVDVLVRYENLSNFSFRLVSHSGGANRKDTYLVSDTGDKWPKLKAYQGGGTSRDLAFLPGVKTKTSMKFTIKSGGEDAKTFTLINWVQILPEKSIGELGWCRLEVKNIPLS